MRKKINNFTNLKGFESVILESIKDGILVFDSDWNYIYLNDLAQKLIGRKDIIGKNVKEIFPEASRSYVFQQYQKSFKTNKPITFEYYSEQHKKWFKIKTYPFDKGLLVYFEDITNEKKHEEQIKATQSLLASIIENTVDAIYVKDKEGRYLLANPATSKLIGKETSKILGKKDSELLPVHVASKISESDQATFKNKKTRVYEEHFIVENGARIFLSTKGTFNDSSGNIAGLIGISRDITDRKNAEKFLEFKSEASRVLSSSLNYRKTLESVAKLAVDEVADWCAVDLLNTDGNPEQLVVIHKDPKKIKWAKSLREKNPVDMSASTGLPKVLRTGETEFYPVITEEMIKAAAKDEEHYKLIRKIGFTSLIIVPLIIQKQVVGAITLVTTESKRRFNKLDVEIAEQLASRASMAIENSRLYQVVKDERARLKNLIANVPGVVWEAYGKPDEANQRINFVSDFTLTLLGYSSDEWLDTPNFWLNIVHPDDKKRAAKESADIFKSGEGGVSRFRWIAKNGKVVWVEAHSSVIKDRDGKPIGMLGVTMDISDRMELEKRKDEFISIASHELKTPLATIKGFTQVLTQYFSKDEKSNYYLTKLNSQIDRLTGLVNDLLDVSRIQSGKLELNRESFHIDELVEDIVDDMKQTVNNHQIIIEGQTRKKVFADKFRISQVLINLISNAVKYSPKSDKVFVKLSNGGDYVNVSIEDFGIGISKRNIGKIFDPFFQAENTIRRSHAGLGLGLHISKEIIERHGGDIKVKSEKKKGSVFSFYLPLKN